MITKAVVTRMVEEQVPVYRCTVCNTVFESNDYGELAARDHAKTHSELIYLQPGNRYCDTVWIDEAALIKNSGPYKASCEINHVNKGRTPVEWSGPGWYIWHEYEVHYQNDTRRYTEFRHVDTAYSELREKLREQAVDLKDYRDLQKKGRP